MVAVTYEVSVSQQRGGLWNGQGRLVVNHLLGQCNAQPINYFPEINLLFSIYNFTMDTIPRLRWHDIPL